jgi:hypothetical protein
MRIGKFRRPLWLRRQTARSKLAALLERGQPPSEDGPKGHPLVNRALAGAKLKRKYKRPQLSGWVPGQPIALKERFNRFHHDFWRSEVVASLKHREFRLLVCLFAQWNGYVNKSSNNGKLKATVGWMKTRGWNTCDDKALAEAINALIHEKKLIREMNERAGGRASLYSLVYLEKLTDTGVEK